MADDSPKFDLVPYDGGVGSRAIPGRIAGPGRPRGAKNKTTSLFWRRAMKETPAIIDKVCERAKAGDMMAARLILDRCWPEPRGGAPIVGIEFSTPAAADSWDRAYAEGQITASDRLALSRAHSERMENVAIVEAADANTQELLTKKFLRAIEEREKGFHNAPSGEQTPAPSPADNVTKLPADRLQDAIDRGDVAALEAIADELDRS